jgi:hypothetical protein
MAISSRFTLLCRATNVAEKARPIPKPLGMISKLSSQEVFPVHRMINNAYEAEAQVDAKIVSSL